MRDDRRRELTPRELHRQRRKEQVARRRLVAGLVLLGIIILIIVLVATCNGGDNGTTTTSTSNDSTSTTLGATTFTAELTGEGDNSTATGTLTLTYDPDLGLSYTLEVQDLDKPDSAGIFRSTDDGSEDAVFTLFAGPAEDSGYSGVLAQGDINEADLTGSLNGGSIQDLIALIADGKAYVSVGTTGTPTNAITGDITVSDETGSTDETVDESTDSTDETTGDTTDSTDGSDTSDTTDTTEG